MNSHIIEVRSMETGRLVNAYQLTLDETLNRFYSSPVNINLTNQSGEVLAKVENRQAYIWDKSYREWTEWLTPEQRRVG